jgi:hypothetical protein
MINMICIHPNDTAGKIQSSAVALISRRNRTFRMQKIKSETDKKVVDKRRIERRTSRMQSERSTTELHAHLNEIMMALKVYFEKNWRFGFGVEVWRMGVGWLDCIVRMDINGYLGY